MKAYNNYIKHKGTDTKKIDIDGAEITLAAKGAYIKISSLTNVKFRMIKKIFTIKIPSGIPAFPPVQKTLYQNAMKRTTIILPRFGVPEKLSNYKIVNNIADVKINTFKWIGKLKSNQRIIHDHIMKNIFNEKNRKNGTSGCILKLGAGLGKSFIALALIISLGRKCLLVTHSTNMVYQWADLISKWAPSIKIGYCYGKSKKDGDIILSIINTAAGDSFRLDGKEYTKSEFFGLFGVVVCDECQLMLSPSAERMYRRCQSMFMLGLSATPNENVKNKDCIAWWNLGPVLDAEEIPGYVKNEVKFTGEVKMIKYLGPHKYTKLIINEKVGVVSVVQMISQLMLDPYRIHVIAKEALRLQKDKYNIFIFADRRNYLEDIRNYMIRLGMRCNLLEDLSKPHKVKRLVGGSTSADMTHAEKYSQIILTTYQYMSVGKSIPKMNAIILATPRKSYNEQTIKRIFRLGSDTNIKRKIIDIVDWKTPMKNQWYQRKKYFDLQGYPIIMRRLEWTDLAKEVEILPKKVAVKNVVVKNVVKKGVVKKGVKKRGKRAKTLKKKEHVYIDDVSESEEPMLNDQALEIFKDMAF